MPLPKPIAIGTLKLMAVIGAAFATAMKRTAKMPTAPVLSPVRSRWSPGTATPSAGFVSGGSKLMDDPFVGPRSAPREPG